MNRSVRSGIVRTTRRTASRAAHDACGMSNDNDNSIEFLIIDINEKINGASTAMRDKSAVVLSHV